MSSGGSVVEDIMREAPRERGWEAAKNPEEQLLHALGTIASSRDLSLWCWTMVSYTKANLSTQDSSQQQKTNSIPEPSN